MPAIISARPKFRIIKRSTGGGGGAASFSYAGSTSTNSGGEETFPGSGVYHAHTRATDIDIGAASANRYVILILGDQNGETMLSATVDGVDLQEDIADTSFGGVRIWSGLAPTGSGTVTIDAAYVGAASFTSRTMHVFVGHNLSTTSGAKSTVSATTSGTLSVASGDLVISAVNPYSTATMSSSEQTITDEETKIQDSLNSKIAYWNTIVSTNASFPIAATGGSNFVAASFG